MFEGITSTEKGESTIWEFRTHYMLYRGWFYATSNSEDTWYNTLDDEIINTPIEYDVRVGAEMFVYIKYQTFAYLESFHAYNYSNCTEYSKWHIEKNLPSKKELTLYKLKNAPMYPEDDPYMKLYDYFIELLDLDLSWESLCDWEAYYCLKD